MEVQLIPIEKISPTAIKRIRSVNENSNAFRELREAVRADGQHYPIIIRKLTEEERSQEGISSEKEYGILDGHHRYEIAAFDRKKEILASVLDYDTPNDTVERKIADTRIALIMNANVPMTALQKGKVLFELSESTDKNVVELGERIFGIKASMSYHYVNRYKKQKNIRTVVKRREHAIDAQLLNDLSDSWNQIPHELSEFDFDDASKCMSQIDKIKVLKDKLNVIEKVLLSQDSVKSERRSIKAALEKNVPLEASDWH